MNKAIALVMTRALYTLDWQNVFFFSIFMFCLLMISKIFVSPYLKVLFTYRKPLEIIILLMNTNEAAPGLVYLL